MKIVLLFIPIIVNGESCKNDSIVTISLMVILLAININDGKKYKLYY